MGVSLTQLDLKPDGSTLRIRFGQKGPVDAEHIGDALASISRLYIEFYRQAVVEAYGNDEAIQFQPPRLSISQVRNGSLSVWLTAVVVQGKLYFDHAKSLLDFGKFLRSAYDFLTSKVRIKTDLTLPQLDALLRTALPVAAANNGHLKIEASDGKVNLKAEYTPAQCKSAITKIRNEIASRRQLPYNSPAKRYLFSWYRATNDASAKTGDRGRIEEISDRAVKTVFLDEHTKSKMLEGPIFEREYWVEARVVYRGESAFVYEIVDLVDIIEKNYE